MCIVPAPYPQEFRDDVVRVASNREPGQRLSQFAKDFGISESCRTNWMRQSDVEDAARPGMTREESSELRDLRLLNRLLEQENEVLRRAAAYLSRANQTNGSICPFPLIDPKNAMQQLSTGDDLIIDFDCTQATDPLPQWAATDGHEAVAFDRTGEAGWTITVRTGT